MVTLHKTTHTLTTEKVVENVTENVTENRSKQIIELIKDNNRVSTSELAKRLNVTRRTIARDIENLKHNNIIRRMGADKGGYWEVIQK